MTLSPIQLLAIRTVERADALGYKGKRADAFAFDTFIAAAQTADILGDKETSEWFARVATWLIATRGMREVRDIAVKALNPVEA